MYTPTPHTPPSPHTLTHILTHHTHPGPKAKTTLRVIQPLTNPSSKLTGQSTKHKQTSPKKHTPLTTTTAKKCPKESSKQILEDNKYLFATSNNKQQQKDEESCDSSELEIVDVISNDYVINERESPFCYHDNQSDSELSMIADDIVEGVVSTGRQSHTPTPLTVATPTEEVTATRCSLKNLIYTFNNNYMYRV